MAKRRLSRNAACPCGSGKKYKQCCWSKGYDWQQDETGRVYKAVPLHPEAVAIIEEQRQQFIAKHGRDWGPDDPIFPDAPHPERIEAEIVAAMKKAKMDPAFIYAFEKTDGLLVTAQNQHLISDEDLAAWDAAIEEYTANHGS